MNRRVDMSGEGLSASLVIYNTIRRNPWGCKGLVEKTGLPAAAVAGALRSLIHRGLVVREKGVYRATRPPKSMKSKGKEG